MFIKRFFFILLLFVFTLNIYAQKASIFSTIRPSYKIADTVQVRGSNIKTLKLKSFATRDSFIVSSFISKTNINADTLYDFIVPNTVKNSVYLINAFNYSNLISDSIRLVRFFVLPTNIDSLGVTAWGSNIYKEINVPAGLNNVVQVETGSLFSIVLKGDGTVVAWGNESVFTTFISIPDGLNNVVQVVGGGNHALALKADGTVVGIGDNYYNQAVVPGGLSNVVQIAAGANHSLALKGDGTVVGWGLNHLGQINTTSLKNVIQITSKNNNSFFLKAEGNVVAFGYNVSRQNDIPAGLNNVIQIASGGFHNLALKADGAVVAWGDTSNKQTTIPAGLNNVVQIAGGGYYSLALKADATLVGWGNNSDKQSKTPTGLYNIVQIAAGDWHTITLNKIFIQTVANTGGIISPSLFVKNGDTYKITYQANAGYFVDSVFINGVLNNDSLTGYTFNNIFQNQTIRLVFTANTVPTKPRNVKAFAGNRKAILTFLPPSRIGSLKIVKYIVNVEGTNIQDSNITNIITIAGLTNLQSYNISVKAINNDGFVSDTAFVRNVIPMEITEIISTNRPIYKIGDTIQLRGNGIKSLKLKSVASGTRDSFVVSNFISKTNINVDTVYNFIVPSTVKNNVYSINAFSYNNQLNDSIRLVRFLATYTDSIEVIGWGRNISGQTNIPQNLNNVAQVAVGGYHSLALKGDGTVVAWGENDYGQSNIFTDLNNVVQVTAGSSFNLALKADGNVVGWGNNNYGQITIPAGLNKVIQIAGGDVHAIALKADGTVVSWGNNYFRQTTVPAGLNNVVQIAAGANHSLALKGDGTLVAWGDTSYLRKIITIPTGLNNVVQIGAGYGINLALKRDGTVVTWGYNFYGEVTIPAGLNLNNVVQIGEGYFHSLALKGDGTILAWGNNLDGKVTIPASLNKAVHIVGGGYHSLAFNKLNIQTIVNSGGTISPSILVNNKEKYRIIYEANLWNYLDSVFINGVLIKDSLTGYTFNNIYQSKTIRVVFNAISAPTKPTNVKAIGGNKKAIISFLPPANYGSKNIVKYISSVEGIDKQDTSENSPITITGLTNFKAYNISVKAINNEGYVSDTAFVSNVIPIGITEIISTNSSTYKKGDTIQLIGNGIKTLKLKSFATRDSFEVSNFISKTIVNLDTLYKFIAPNTVKNDVYLINAFSYKNQISESIRLVRFFVLPTNIDSIGALGWGYKGYGATSIPAGLNNVVQIAGGRNHSLALKGNGTVVAWGDNGYGQTSIPAGLNNVVQISGGSNNSLALKGDGTVLAWGYNLNGQTIIPTGLNNVVQIACGTHNLALKGDGTVVAWGYNGFEQTNIPAGLNNVVQIGVGGGHSLALKVDGTVVAWGYNEYGQTSIPNGLNNVVQIAGGSNHSLALKEDGTVIAWGDTNYEQTSIPAGLNDVVQIAGGSNHSLALKSDGNVVAWGKNIINYGQTSIPNGLNNVVQIAGGINISLAINKLSIQTNANTGGIISPTIFVKNGDSYRITFEANDGYFVDSVFINGVLNNDSLNGYTFNSINQFKTIRVVFNEFRSPTKPRNVIGIGGNKKAILTFLPPANFGSRNIVKYIAKVEGTNIEDSNINSPIIIYGLTNLQTYNISVKAINNEGLVSDTILVTNITPLEITEIISTNRPTYKIGDTIQLRGNGIKTLKLKSVVTRDSFEVSDFISKTIINSDTIYNFIVPNNVKNEVYLINAFSYSDQISDSISLVRFFVLPTNIDSLGVIGWGNNDNDEITIPAGLNNVVQVAGGDIHSLALKGDGTVVAWGYNVYGQTSIPAGLNNVVQIATGTKHSLALKGDGTVVAWGNNEDGQTSVPAGLNNVVQIAGVGIHSIALKGDGTVVAWSDNGDGLTSIPVGLKNVVQIAGGIYNILALKQDGTVVAWGDNNFEKTSIPVGLNNVVQIAIGNNHILALKGDSTVVAWGDNFDGQSTIPNGLNNVVQIAAGNNYSLALKGDGTVVAIGNNRDGQTSTPAGLNNVVQIAGGNNYSLAINKLSIQTDANTGGIISPTIFVKNGDRYRITYQANAGYFVDSIFINGVFNSDSLSGYTFNNIYQYQTIRVVFNAYSAPTKPRNVIAIGGNKKIILTFLPPADFGSRNILKYIAKIEGTDIQDSNNNSPITITGLTNLQTYTISLKAINNEGLESDTILLYNIMPLDNTEIISTNRSTYKIGDTIQVRGNGIKTLKLKSIATKDSFEVRNFISKTIIESDTIYNFIIPNTVKNDVYLINAFSYFNQISDSIRLVRFFVLPKNIESLFITGWGDNVYGETSIPADINNVVQIAGGRNHSLALKGDGTLVAWGENGFGQTTIPVGLNSVVQIAVGGGHDLALKGDGTVVAWGYNKNKQTSIPTGLNNVVQIAGGNNHSLALKGDGTVVAWGDNEYEQTSIPVGLNNVVQIGTGWGHSLAIKKDGTVVAWGDNEYGQTSIPAGLNNVIQIVGGTIHSLALKKDGTVVAWGDNSNGPTTIPAGLNNVVQIAGGGVHNLALKADGTVVDWGRISYVETNTPAGLNNVVQIAAGTDHNLALFKGYKVNTSVNIGGTISASKIVFVNANYRVTYNAINNNISLDSIFINSVYDSAITKDSTNGYTFTNINSNKSIKLVYKIPTFTITAISGSYGSISMQGITNVNYGARPTYVISPNIGYEIENLFVNGIKVNNINIYTFDSVKSNQTIIVTFKIQTFTITSSAGTGGSITPQGTNIINYGATPSYTISTNTGFVIDSLIINNIKINNVNIYTFDSVKSNQTIRVTFKSNTVCPSTKVTPNIVRIGNSLQSDITSFAKHRWYLDGTKKDSTIANSYTPQTAGVYTLLGLDANGCESNLSKKYYYAQTCITPTGRIGNGAFIQGSILGNNNEIIIKWCSELIHGDIIVQVIDINGMQVLEQKVASNNGTYILNKQIISAKKYVIKVINNKGEVLQISDFINY